MRIQPRLQMSNSISHVNPHKRSKSHQTGPGVYFDPNLSLGVMSDPVTTYGVFECQQCQIKKDPGTVIKVERKGIPTAHPILHTVEQENFAYIN